MRAWNKKRKPKHHSKAKWVTTYLFDYCWVTDLKTHDVITISKAYRPLNYLKIIKSQN